MTGYDNGAKWISHPEMTLFDWRFPTLPAPVFRKRFELKERPADRTIAWISGLGFYELYINGRKVSEYLVPAMTRYDVRWRYRKYDVTPYLKKGWNVITVFLGNGLYNCQTPEVWHFDKADWREYPKMIFQLTAGGKTLLVSDTSWIVNYSATVFDSLRGGEVYDAQLEIDYHTDSGLYEKEADSAGPAASGRITNIQRIWRHAAIKAAPGGIAAEETFPPCGITAVYDMKKIPGTDGLYRAPFNISGWCRICVKGEAGASITLYCGEKLYEHGKELDTRAIRCSVKDSTFQRDQYILKGGNEEIWEPRFTYHGFQYVQVKTTGKIQVLNLKACFVHTDLPRHGKVEPGRQDLRWLDEAALRSCLSNFVGIPTDCPHREKNGWTSEAQLMQEYLLYSCDAAEAYQGFAELIGDAQRSSGQVPGMVPTAGWCYNCLNGPVYDSALFAIPYTNWLFTGKTKYIRALYPHMEKYLRFCESIMENGLISYGLGDWVPPRETTPLADEFVQNAFLKRCYDIAAECALILKKTHSAGSLRAKAQRLKDDLNRVFYKGAGHYDSTRSTAYALALQFDLIPEEDRALCAAALVKVIRAHQWKVDYGTAGSKAVPRALFENGYADDAFRLMTQEGSPGYQFWRTQGATTFPELWERYDNSLNHGAFADIGACLYRYLAGFRHVPGKPSARYLEIAPCFPRDLDTFQCEYCRWQITWNRTEKGIHLALTVPRGAEGILRLPGKKAIKVKTGICTYNIKQEEYS